MATVEIDFTEQDFLKSDYIPRIDDPNIERRAYHMGLAVGDALGNRSRELVNTNFEYSPYYRALMFSCGIPFDIARALVKNQPVEFQTRYAELNEQLENHSRQNIQNIHNTTNTLSYFTSGPDITTTYLRAGGEEKVKAVRALLGIAAQDQYLSNYVWFGNIERYLREDDWDTKLINQFDTDGNPPLHSINESELNPEKLHIKIKPEDLYQATIALAQIWAKHTYGSKEEKGEEKEEEKREEEVEENIYSPSNPPFYFKVAIGNGAYGQSEERIRERAYSAKGLPPRLVVYTKKDGLNTDELMDEINTALVKMNITADESYPVRFHKRTTTTSLIDVVIGDTQRKGNTRKPENDL